MNRGFTVVEILVTLVILAILLTLGTVGMRSVIANGRDSERSSDITTISRAFELRYSQGNSTFVASPGYESLLRKGGYPGIAEMLYGMGYPKGEFSPSSLSGGRENLYKALSISKAAMTTPSGNEIEIMCYNFNAPCGSPAPAEDTAKIAAVFSGNADRYVYEPIDVNGNVCNLDFQYGECVRYNLYWISETDPAVNMGIAGLKVLRSKHQ